MRLIWLPLLCVLLLVPAASADPTISRPTSHEGVATWTFSNPGNYSAVNVSLVAGTALLTSVDGTVGDTGAAEFAQALILDNVDTASRPGDAVLLDTSGQGPVTPLSFGPTPSQLDDNYLWNGAGANVNFGASPDLFVGFWGNPEWYRAVLRWPNLPLPSNATLVSAELQMYLHAADTPDAMDVSVHRVTTSWTEFGSDWNDYDGSNPWNASGGGGDFDPAVIDAVPGITNATGWYTWNITSVAQAWWSGTTPNQGILVRQSNDDLRVSLGRKQFYSSDAANASARPRLLLAYTTPSSSGTLESRVLGPATPSDWLRVWWNATVPAGTTLGIQSRTGTSPVIDASWSAWSGDYASPGSPVTSPSASFVQYRARLFTPSRTSPILHDVTLQYAHFAPVGIVVTEAFLPETLVAWGRLDMTWSGRPGTNVSMAFSADNGTSWTPSAAGTILAGAPSRAIALRLLLSTNDTTETPVLRWVSLTFELGESPGGFLYLPVVGPYWLLLIPFLILAAYTLTRAVLRKPFQATDLFLIHSDGRLILRVGGRESPLRDELAVSAMFTLVAQFVKDSFRSAEGEGGELRNFQVDDQEVTIGRGGYLFLALLGKGAPPPELEGNLARFVGSLERDEWAALFAWDGFREGLNETERRLVRFLRKGYRNRRILPRSDGG